MKKKRSERKPVGTEPATKRVTRNKAREQLDEIQEPPLSKIEPRFLLKESPVCSFFPDVRRNPDFHSREMDPSLEETLLTFLDTHGVRDVEDIEEDKLTFIDATYARSGMQANASVPTQKIFQAILDNIQESQSVELTMASFQLLKDLEKCHPQVAIAEELDETSGQMTLRLNVDKRVWSPIQQTIKEMEAEMQPESSTEEQFPLNLLTLLETIVMNKSEDERQHMKGVLHDSSAFHKILGQFLMLRHLVSLLQKDLCCRWHVSEARMDASPVRKSYIYRLICALLPDLRKTFFLNLVNIMNPNPQQTPINAVSADNNEGDECLSPPPATTKDTDASIKPELLPSPSDFSHLAYRLLLMVVETDHITKKWTRVNARSLRKDRFPTEVFSIFRDASDLEVYLQALNNPWSKMRFIVDYFVTYCPAKIDVKGLKDNIDTETMEKLLTYFGEDKTGTFVHKFSEDVLPLLLAHAFQAFLSMHAEAVGRADAQGRERHQTKLIEVSQNFTDTLKGLRGFEQEGEMLQVAEEAFEMAESILQSLLLSRKVASSPQGL